MSILQRRRVKTLRPVGWNALLISVSVTLDPSLLTVFLASTFMLHNLPLSTAFDD